jgi:hypothetical protein
MCAMGVIRLTPRVPPDFELWIHFPSARAAPTAPRRSPDPARSRAPPPGSPASSQSTLRREPPSRIAERGTAIRLRCRAEGRAPRPQLVSRPRQDAQPTPRAAAGRQRSSARRAPASHAHRPPRPGGSSPAAHSSRLALRGPCSAPETRLPERPPHSAHRVAHVPAHHAARADGRPRHEPSLGQRRSKLRHLLPDDAHLLAVIYIGAQAADLLRDRRTHAPPRRRLAQRRSHRLGIAQAAGTNHVKRSRSTVVETDVKGACSHAWIVAQIVLHASAPGGQNANATSYPERPENDLSIERCPISGRPDLNASGRLLSGVPLLFGGLRCAEIRCAQNGTTMEPTRLARAPVGKPLLGLDTGTAPSQRVRGTMLPV